MNSPDRLALVRSEMAKAGVKGLLVSDWASIFYLSGFDGDTGWLLIGPDSQFILSDSRFTVQASEQAEGFEYVDTTSKVWDILAMTAKESGLLPLGIDPRKTTLAEQGWLRHKLRKKDLKPAEGLAELGRGIKDADELALIRKAAKLTDEALLKILKASLEGLTEAQLAALFEYEVRMAGADKTAFPSIIAGGANAAKPHANCEACVPRRGEVLLFDLGASFHHYASDTTRTYSVGKPRGRMIDVYAAVWEAQRAAVEAVGPDVPWKQVDAAARDILRRTGWNDYFRHGIGHSVGIGVHDPSPRRRSDDTELILAPGMVMTVEPGVYLEGEGGVRIEDLVLVTDSGCEVLTAGPNPERLTSIEEVLAGAD